MIIATTQKASQVIGGVETFSPMGITIPNHRNTIYSRCTTNNDFKRKERLSYFH